MLDDVKRVRPVSTIFSEPPRRYYKTMGKENGEYLGWALLDRLIAKSPSTSSSGAASHRFVPLGRPDEGAERCVADDSPWVIVRCIALDGTLDISATRRREAQLPRGVLKGYFGKRR